MIKKLRKRKHTEKENVKEGNKEYVKENDACSEKECARVDTCCCTSKRVVAYRDERFLFGFVSGLAIAAIAGFIILSNTVANTGTKEPRLAVEITKEDWTYGNPDAKVAIVEFSDIECPYCKSFYKTLKEIVDNSDGKIKWVYRHAPLDSLHPNARLKAHVIECIGAQGGNDTFWTALDDIILNKVELATMDDFDAFIKKLGADNEKFKTCMESGLYAVKIQEHLEESQKLGMKGTPFSVIVAGKKTVPIPGALKKEQVMSLINPFLKK